MNKRIAGLGFWTVAFAAAGLATSLAVSQPVKEKEGGDDEVTIKLSEAPEAVRTAALKLTAEKNISNVVKETEEGITIFEVEFNEGGATCSGTFTSAGETLEVERGLTEGKVPAAALAAVKKANPGATLSTMTSVTKMFYEIEVVQDGKKHEVKVNAAGEIEKPKGAKEDDEKDEDDEKNEKHEKK